MQRPHLVDEALSLARSNGFQNSCLDEVGELLYILAGHIRSGIIAEIGTGYGVSTAWLASATTTGIYTVDVEPERMQAVRELFKPYPNVHPVLGDWEQLLGEGPFELVFVDAKPPKLEGIQKIVDATAIGGLIVIDDLTPVEFWPDEWRGRPDVVRETWLGHPQLASMEVRTSLKASAIIGRRIS